MADTTFEEKIAQLKGEVEALEADVSADVIEQTAERLEGLNYAPPVTVATGTFLRLTKQTLLEEIDKILALPDQEACALAPDEPLKCQDLRVQFISVLIFYYRKLILLRQEDLDTWDEIDELYVHD